jgi:pimeloyl-ACP methyl ester carboxylesterase
MSISESNHGVAAMTKRNQILSPLFLLMLILSACASKHGHQKSTLEDRGYDAVLSQYNYPFAVGVFKFKSQGQDMQMAYMDLKSGISTDKTVVLLHGKNFSGFYFERMAKFFLVNNYRVIIPDQIGFGKSSKPADYQYSFQQLADNTQQLLNSLGVTRYMVLGHSMGGMLATRMALMYPEKIQRVFLIDPIGLEDYRTLTPYRTIDEVYATEAQQSPEQIRKYQQENYYHGTWKDSYDVLINAQSGWTFNKDFPIVAKASALTYDMIYTQPVVYEFKNLKMPTYLLIGLEDRTAIGKAWASDANKKKMGDYPRLGKEVAKMNSKIKLMTMKGVGHVPFIEDPDGFEKVFKKALL